MEYSNTLSDEVFNLLNIRKRKCADYLSSIQNKLTSDEKYDTLQRKINKLNFLIGKAMSCGEDYSTIEKEKIQLETLQKNRLKELNIKESDLKLKHFCKVCKDTGFIGSKPCSCFLKLYNKLLFKKLGINKKTLATFEDDTLSQKTELSILYTKFIRYCKEFNPNSKSYIFYGKCGTGKTFLSECIASEVQKNGSVLYLTAFELNDFFIKYHSCDINEKGFYYSILSEADLVVIDDLGTEPIYNKVTLEYLYLLLSARKDKPLIISTNLSPKEIFDRYGERIFSRLFQNKQTQCIDFAFDNLRNIK